MPSSFRRIRSRAVFCLALLSLSSVAAHAQDPTAPAEAPSAGSTRRRSRSFYISLYTGSTSSQSSDLRLTQPRLGTDVTYRDVSFEGRPFTGSPYYGLKVGYFLPKTPRVGFELEFNHAKMYAKLGESKQLTGTWQGQPVNTVEPLSDRIDRYQITNGINALSFNILYRVPVIVSDKYPDGRLQPYIGGGPQYTALYSINQIDGLGVSEKYHPNGWGYQLFGGARYLLNTHLGAFIEGKYQHGDAASIIADQGDDQGGRGDADIRMAQLAGGLFYQF
ncbi:MAG: outer membrane beta-barrel protein [Akkermansiaceae bacterium]|nr:outer membrane beta-barrel protein [Armatimonadota bacterium]